MHSTLGYYDVQTRQATNVHPLGTLGVGRLTLSPDGRSLVWMQADKIEGGDLRLVANFH